MIKKTKKHILTSAVTVVFLVLLDRITKFFASYFLKGKPSVPIIKNIFELQYLENQSAAFGMDPVSFLHNIFSFSIFEQNPNLFLTVKMGFFVIFTVIILICLVIAYLRIPDEKKYRYMDWILLFFISGAIGNFIDRLTYQYVIDFFYFKLINFPIFNVADIYVTVSAFFMIVLGFFYYKDEDFEVLYEKRSI
uniref:signal peptidase II n=1 Tax=Agathobacter sp. TaxID=2021311 RepID=UPI004055DAE8